jgi:plastocyanin
VIPLLRHEAPSPTTTPGDTTGATGATTRGGGARRRVALLACVLALAAFASTACGDDGDEGGSGATSNTAGPDVEWEDLTGEDAVTVDTRDNTFSPENITVSAGAEVTWDNRGRNPHNAIPVDEDAFDEIALDELQPGDAVTRTFDEPGEYPYYCTLHGTPDRGMIGRIRVVEG